jgi:hypothetical protein
MAKNTKKKARDCAWFEAMAKHMAGEIRNYASLRDEEWEFSEKHGDRCLWEDEIQERYDRLCADILKSTRKLERAVRKVLDDSTITL